MITFTAPAAVVKARRRPALSDIEWEIRRLLLAAVGKVTDSTSTQEIRRALEAGNVTEALDRVRFDLGEDFLRSTLPASIRDAYEAVGPVAAADTARLVGSGYSFNLITPRAVDWTASTAGSLIHQWGESSRDTIRRIIAQGFAAGDGAGVIAQQIRQSGIGITWRSARAVLNMRQRMEADGAPASSIETQATRYYNRLVRDRAEMVARTEMTRAMTHARLESWRQAIDRGLLDSGGYEKEWLATHDSRACDECLDLDGARASVPDGIFVGAGGTNGGIGPGYHPRCRCTVLLVEKGSARTARAQRNIPGDAGIRKYNENHDELGRFASGDGGGGGGDNKAAVESYTRSGFKTINPALREGGTLSDADQKTVAALDRLTRHEATTHAELYRGVALGSQPLAGHGAQLAGRDEAERVRITNDLTDRWVAERYPVGSEFSDAAFVSTSKDLAAPLDASTSKQTSGMVLRIRGASGYDLSKLSGYDDETEVLLPRGSRFRVAGVGRETLTDVIYGRDYSRTVVTVDVLP